MGKSTHGPSLPAGTAQKLVRGSTGMMTSDLFGAVSEVPERCSPCTSEASNQLFEAAAQHGLQRVRKNDKARVGVDGRVERRSDRVHRGDGL